MAKNTLEQLNDQLFAQLTKLSATGKDDLKSEIDRTNAICNVASQVVANASLALKAQCIAQQIQIPEMLQITERDE